MNYCSSQDGKKEKRKTFPIHGMTYSLTSEEKLLLHLKRKKAWIKVTIVISVSCRQIKAFRCRGKLFYEIHFSALNTEVHLFRESFCVNWSFRKVNFLLLEMYEKQTSRSQFSLITFSQQHEMITEQKFPFWTSQALCSVEFSFFYAGENQPSVWKVHSAS